ncbi:MAG: ADP-ribosylglycohydrolase family protein [Clostridia bacterium]|nr:ADP-ribosylglycohydrolase family protein [Clostridia bacterium]
MYIGTTLARLRAEEKMTQEQFAEHFGVSQQAVQKWESGASTPDLDKLIAISKHFGLSLDTLILGSDNRVREETNRIMNITPRYEIMHKWELYSGNLATEYQQSVEEGLDIELYKDVFSAAAKLPNGEVKKKLGDVLFDIVCSAKTREGYPYIEPSDLASIKELRASDPSAVLPENRPTDALLENKIHGAWVGRMCGCLLGMAFETVRTNELIPFLRETGNYPLHRYMLSSDIDPDRLSKYKFNFAIHAQADRFHAMPADDDTNYTVLAQEIIRRYGRDFTPHQVAGAWLDLQKKNAYCTAERIAYCNFVRGFVPPQSAMYQNPYREWIGAQIRCDYYGYINPGDPERAAEMAWRDASISHTKNGIYGSMFICAMIAAAAVTDDRELIVKSGLARIPRTSRLYKDVSDVLDCYRSGKPSSECFAMIHERYDEYDGQGWCHAISNSMIVAAALLWGGGDYGKSICMAVETGFDTDCNGATVGSIVGMIIGIDNIPDEWTKPINDTLHTTIFGVGTVKISDRVKLTLEHIGK